MFKSKHKSAAHITLIAEGTEIRGDVEFAGSVQVEGKVKGNLRAANNDRASIMVIHGAEVVGDITAPEVMINGTVKGDIYATVRVELAPDARIEGDVRYRSLEMMAGAQINGSLIHEEHQVTLPAPDSVKKESTESESNND